MSVESLPYTPARIVSHDSLAPGTAAPPRGLLNPYLHLGLGILLVTASELLLKRGASAVAGPAGGADWTGLSSLGSWWVWGGIALYVTSFLCWLHVLRYIALIVAFNLMNAVHILVPVGSWAFLAERVPPNRVLGILLILFGLVVLSRPMSRLEERL